jgi:ABC-type amino acid transport substrate-binding protein
VPDYKLEDSWNVAIAMRRGDDELKRHVDRAVAKLVDQGAVSRLLARYHMPYFPPNLQEMKTDAKVRKHAATNRGLEPQMDRRQRSRTSYAGLERVRAKGQLVVGLDQNNPPFSTAHPAPAGLDYEIAGLLAKQLGVPLQVYWAYSSHDSYPSKLATKDLCDAILGVMPDDRFGQRVLFSKPYYVASYQLVTAIDRDKLSGVEPLAIESGVAVRGIQGRNLKRYPSLEEVLAAVATGKETVGYVVSTQGHWLAEKRWPGKLRFVDVPESVDKVPLCVAVRKNDGDLKVAIDTALNELAQSGRLAEVFARWHIPYASAAAAGVSDR